MTQSRSRAGIGLSLGQLQRGSGATAGAFCHVGKAKDLATPRPKGRNDCIQSRRRN